jgi:hypothetical protein
MDRLSDIGLGLPNLPPPHQVCCDLCEGVMTVPSHCAEQGQIIGLLTCSQCIEDELQSRVCQ